MTAVPDDRPPLADPRRAPSTAAVLVRWPAARPLAALVSADGDPEHGRWSVLGVAGDRWTATEAQLGRGSAAVASLRSRLTPPGPARSHSGDAGGGSSRPRPIRTAPAEGANGASGAGGADRAATADDPRPDRRLPPFGPGWIVALAYDLGRCFEPVLDPEGPTDDRGWPAVAATRLDAGLVRDEVTGDWWCFGDVPPDVLEAWRSASASRSDAAPDAWPAGPLPAPERTARPSATPTATAALGPWTTSLSGDAHVGAVRAAREAIARGDVFQVNVTRRLTGPCGVGRRTLALAALDVGRPRYGAVVELPDDRALVSLSPELFLHREAAAGRLRTRPIKGTRPADGDPAELLAAPKDAAELDMIVDLMRNDLGRIAERGRVRVTRTRFAERHATVLQGVAEVTATVAADVHPADILAATFPPGSVTGAPKIQAMHTIDALEPVRRGPYCGSIGWIGDDGSLHLNVAIRTLAIHGPDAAARVDYAAGGGIVSDSDPIAEVHEAETKTTVLRYLAARLDAARRSNQTSPARTTPAATAPVGS